MKAFIFVMFFCIFAANAQNKVRLTDDEYSVLRKDILLDTGLSDTSVDQQLRNLVAADLIKRVDQGKYSL